MSKTYDVIVIGAGAAGFSAAEAARSAGASVCLVEKERLGGECPNWGCVPSKAFLKSAEVARTIREARYFGIVPNGFSVDFSAVRAHERQAVETVTGGGAQGERYVDALSRLKVAHIIGEARFEDRETICVKTKEGEERLHGQAFVLAVGALPYLPSIDGMENVKILTPRTILEITSLPKSMAIIGAGPIGCEYATFFASLGTDVSLLEAAPTVMSREEPAISGLALEALKNLGIDVRTSTVERRVWDSQGGIFGLEIERAGKRETLAVEWILAATGKRGNSENLNLAAAGLTASARGYIETKADMRTSVPRIFAAGDLTGGAQFTHAAHRQGEVAGFNAALCVRKSRRTYLRYDDSVLPRVAFIDTEVASVGPTIAEAKAKYKRLFVAEADMNTIGRSVTDHELFGKLIIVADGKTGRVLGGHMIGERAGEVIHEVALAVYSRLTLAKWAGMLHAFPTYSEIVVQALDSTRQV